MTTLTPSQRAFRMIRNRGNERVLREYEFVIARLALLDETPQELLHYKLRIRGEILSRTGSEHRSLVYGFEYLTSCLALDKHKQNELVLSANERHDLILRYMNKSLH